MPSLSRLPRLTFACLCLCAAAWVAMPAVQLLFGDGGLDRVGPPRAAPLERRTSDPPRHVIRETAPEPRSEESIWKEAFEKSAPPAGIAAGIAAGIGFSDPAAASPPPAAPPSTGPLPPLPPAFSRRPPALDATYRSTVEMPPPPLLDAHSPPPLSVARLRADSRSRGSEPRPSAGVPQHYVVRDGDDLTGIAVRFYGNPAAAEAIFLANRDRLADPKILPIGLALQLPAAGSAGVPSGDRDRLIEPL